MKPKLLSRHAESFYQRIVKTVNFWSDDKNGRPQGRASSLVNLTNVHLTRNGTDQATWHRYGAVSFRLSRYTVARVRNEWTPNRPLPTNRFSLFWAVFAITAKFQQIYAYLCGSYVQICGGELLQAAFQKATLLASPRASSKPPLLIVLR